MNFKKFISAGAAVAVCASFAFSVSSFSQISAAEANSILVFGDSIANGNNGTTMQFPEIIREYVSADSYRNYAKNGLTSEDVLNSVKANTESIKNADTVIISAGGNDYLEAIKKIAADYVDDDVTADSITKDQLLALKEIIKKDPAEAATKLSAITDKTDPAAQNVAAAVQVVKDNNPDAKIYILSLYNPVESFADTDSAAMQISNLANSITNTFNTKISTYSKRVDANFSIVPVKNAFTGHTDDYINVASRDIHPTDAGQIKIASLIISDITSEESDVVLGKIFGTLTDEQYSALPSVLTDGVSVIKPAEPSETEAPAETAAPEESSANTEETTAAETTAEAVSTSADSVVTEAPSSSSAGSSNTSGSAVSGSVASAMSSPATSDNGIASVAVTGLFAAAACIALRKKNS